EPQILTQVRAAHRFAAAESVSGPVVSSLFAEAARAGRRVRAETGIGASPHAFVEAGIDLAERALGPLQDRRALVVGAGSMANLAVEHLHQRAVRDLHILNRSPGRAERLASKAGASSGDLSALRDELATADLVVSLTGASNMVISRADVEPAAPKHRFLLDLAVPRDVDPAVQEVPGVQLVDLFDVRGHLERTSTATEEALAAAREIVTEEVRRFSLRRRSERVAPLIRALLARGDEIRAAELRRFASQLSELSEDQREAVNRLAEGIVAKLLHPPVVALKEGAAAGSADEAARMLAELFRLGPPKA
ncbi:MAG: glutamyl-tRNA reductase, partial [Actinomycetota bacterium]|nr:glutamyl-tRNA reductase [Actinomycetota bacterium]